MRNVQRKIRRHHRPKGAVLVLSAVLMVVLMALMAFSVDIGYVYMVRTELQRTADASAMASAWELLAEEERISGGDLSAAKAQAQTFAATFAGLNLVSNSSPALDSSDVTVGYRANVFDNEEPIDVAASDANIVRVRVRRSSDINGALPLFFARALGISDIEVHAQATAGLLTDFGGFKAPSDGGNLDILPFALDHETWSDLLNGGGDDNWTYDEESGQVYSGSDQVREVNLYPQGTGSPGNRGTVDIGSFNNSTADISRQILHGITPADLDFHGGSLEFDASGELHLNADTGISAGFKDELAAIIGDPRMIPIFQSINGNGNNAMYTIIHLCGVRIVDVKLTGPMSQKRVIVQPCALQSRGGIPGNGTQKTYFVYSPVALIQ